MTQPRPLSLQAQQFLKPYFTTEVLAQARIVDGRVPFWLRRNMSAVVIYNHIYFRCGAYQPNTVHGLALLAHELMHVAQYQSGMTIWSYLWSCRHGYRNSPYEIQAYALAKRVMQDFTQLKLATLEFV